MNKNLRKAVIAGNWKMNKTPAEAVELVKGLIPLVKDAKCDVVVCPTYVCLETVKKLIAGTNIKIGAQNMHWEDKGAYTGEVSGAMLKDLGVEYVIIGHSERREYFGETNETVNRKAHAAFKYGLKPIICVGESLLQRDEGVTAEHVRYQVKVALKDLSAEQVETLILAYEPIWAIGTGRTATTEQAQEVCKIIRDTVGELYGSETAEKVRIQYGGSVNAETAEGLFRMPDIDGGLVGGASLKVKDFTIIAGDRS